MHGLAFGMGRSYGDVCLNPGGLLWLTRSLYRMLSFDPETGILHCEAGVLLREIQESMIPRGWALPVVPGTQIVTVGGAIANDVHGKNHHAFGTFGAHVVDFGLRRTDGAHCRCSAHDQPELFAATIGGLGLTGLITDARIRLRRLDGPWLDSETLPFADLEEFAQIAASSSATWEHTVAWVDCVGRRAGRGLFMRANWSPERAGLEPPDRALAMPIVPPVSVVNSVTLRAMNALYYARNARVRGVHRVHYRAYFHPLDAVGHWNRAYGPRGFYQYQCVVPPEQMDAIGRMLALIAASGQGSFLAVLKTFSERRSPGLLSFPMPGITLALDFPNRGRRTLALFDRLDELLLRAGGRLYPAKDARMSRAVFQAGYPELQRFRAFRDPGIDSAMARRLL